MQQLTEENEMLRKRIVELERKNEELKKEYKYCRKDCNNMKIFIRESMSSLEYEARDCLQKLNELNQYLNYTENNGNQGFQFQHFGQMNQNYEYYNDDYNGNY